LRGSEGKWLLKRALKAHLPASLLDRPKMGFAVPLAAWFRGPLRERVRSAVLGDRLLGTGYFDARQLGQMVKQHESGLRDHSAPLWSLLMFDAFIKRAATTNSSTELRMSA
jgi:asparagine synthase (glutamine-hydrolysing)